MPAQLTRRLFTVEDYYRMVDAGILGARDRVELIEGEVLAMSPIGSPHAAAVDRAARATIMTLGPKAIVRIQNPVRLNEYSEPEPDISLLRPRDDFYAKGHPLPNDVLLIIEIADSSLEYDLKVKAPLYAASGIVEYWVADLIHDCVVVHTNIIDREYAPVHEFRRGEAISPQLLPGCSINVADLLA